MLYFIYNMIFFEEYVHFDWILSGFWAIENGRPDIAGSLNGEKQDEIAKRLGQLRRGRNGVSG